MEGQEAKLLALIEDKVYVVCFVTGTIHPTCDGLIRINVIWESAKMAKSSPHWEPNFHLWLQQEAKPFQIGLQINILKLNM